MECASCCPGTAQGSPAQAGRWAGRCLNHSELEGKALGRAPYPTWEQNRVEVGDIHHLHGQELEFSFFGKKKGNLYLNYAMNNLPKRFQALKPREKMQLCVRGPKNVWGFGHALLFWTACVCNLWGS